MPHGTVSRYKNDGCRCFLCGEAARVDLWRYRSIRGGLGVHGPRLLEHNRTRYVKGCRCDVCRRAEADYRRRYRARTR